MHEGKPQGKLGNNRRMCMFAPLEKITNLTLVQDMLESFCEDRQGYKYWYSAVYWI